MKKLESLRAAITTALPDLKAAPKNLRLWVDRGTSQSRQTQTFGFGLKYRLNILLLDFAGDLGPLGLALWIWIRTNQVNLMGVGEEGFAFEVDVLDDRKADLLLQLDLSENLSAKPKDGGGFSLSWLPEPDPMFPETLALDGNTTTLPLSAIVIEGEGDLGRDGTMFDG